LLQEEATAVIGELDGSSGQGFGVRPVELFSVDQGEDETVDEQRTGLFHEVQRERWFARADAGQISEIGIKSDLLKRTVDGDAEHPVTEGEQTVDWIEGRSTGAAGHGTGRKKREPTEVVTGRVSFGDGT
jgi:hypothetical protein